MQSSVSQLEATQARSRVEGLTAEECCAMPGTDLQSDSPRNSTRSSRRNNLARGSRGRRVPRQERSILLVDCIRIAACEILEKDGPNALTTNNIAIRAGVSIGSLYQYFANKEEILEEVFREQADRSFEDSRQWADWVRTLPLRNVIRLLVERAIRRHREFLSFHPEFYGRHHDELPVGLRVMEEANGTDGEPYAVAWLREVFEARRDELRVPDPRLASIALAHGVSAMLHGLVESEQSLLYDDSLVENLAAMVCGFLLHDECEDVQDQRRCTG
ncbi:MAG: TetR/AcrR family transcriptional regulator [Deltaproteobacteria bacterium]|nr:TetR/AcrR family transcriptional regulator [Deltaproteobacteria bacterium]MBW2723568.1 TetR/AcrR family transcriptional regulator [Deltaproteobacteria bacterium]